MTDFLYVIGTIGFFALMLGYVVVCERLGRASDDDTVTAETRK